MARGEKNERTVNLRFVRCYELLTLNIVALLYFTLHTFKIWRKKGSDFLIIVADYLSWGAVFKERFFTLIVQFQVLQDRWYKNTEDAFLQA